MHNLTQFGFEKNVILLELASKETNFRYYEKLRIFLQKLVGTNPNCLYMLHNVQGMTDYYQMNVGTWGRGTGGICPHPFQILAGLNQGSNMLTILLKVRKSQKKNMLSWILPKNKRWGHFMYWKLPQRSFFGRIQDTIICFWDLLTFSRHMNSVHNINQNLCINYVTQILWKFSWRRFFCL